MLHSTNPEIDSDRLRHHIDGVATHCRHARPLALPPLPGHTPDVGRVAGWRQRLRHVPWLGSSLVWARARWWRVRTPGLSLAQRLRAVPVLGDLAAWGLAFVTLPRWRAELRDHVAAQQAQLQDLRNQQVQLQQELKRLRAASADVQAPRPQSLPPTSGQGEESR